MPGKVALRRIDTNELFGLMAYVVSPTGKTKWTRAAVDKLLANKKYIP